MSRFLKVWATLLLAALPMFPCKAEVIDLIWVEVQLQPDGSAVVLQRWIVTPDSGSEMFIPIENLGQMSVSDFQVWENEQPYANDGRLWDSSRSRIQKSGRCGIIDKGSGVELCWGKGELDARHDWTLRYHLHGLVQAYDDYDGFYFMFVADQLNNPRKARITVFPPDGVSFTDEQVAYWAFGFEGEIHLDTETGQIVADAPDGLGWNNPMLVMMRLDKGLVSPEIRVDKPFEKLQKQAFKGSDYSSGTSAEDWFFIIIGLLVILLGLFLFLLLLYYIIRHFLGFKYKKRMFGTRKITGWWRDVPFPESLEASFHVLKEGQDFLSHAPDSEIMGAYFLRWVMDGLVTVQPAAKKDRVNLVFPEVVPETLADAERGLFDMAIQAAGTNYMLEQGEFDSWARKHYTRLTNFPGHVSRIGKGWLQDHGYYEGEAVSPASQEAFRHVVEFRNFLRDFTLSSERTVGEVRLWKDYLIYAQLFGIADKVAAQFKKLYPTDFDRFARQYGMTDVMLLNTIGYSRSVSSRAMSSAFAQKAAAEQKQRSSGHGGRSSIGFGGGFSGGGHGGSR